MLGNKDKILKNGLKLLAIKFQKLNKNALINLANLLRQSSIQIKVIENNLKRSNKTRENT